MTEGVELHLFETYQGFDIMDTVRAAKVTKENLQALAELTGGDLCAFTGTNGAKLDDKEKYIWLPNPNLPDPVVCVGDYIRENAEGHYYSTSSEMFEKRYAKRV